MFQKTATLLIFIHHKGIRNKETNKQETKENFGFFMAVLCNRAGHYIFALWFLSSSLFTPRLISAAADWMSTITGSAVHCCKAHSNINRKMANSTPCKMVTPENLKMGIKYLNLSSFGQFRQYRTKSLLQNFII